MMTAKAPDMVEAKPKPKLKLSASILAAVQPASRSATLPTLPLKPGEVFVSGPITRRHHNKLLGMAVILVVVLLVGVIYIMVSNK